MAYVYRNKEERIVIPHSEDEEYELVKIKCGDEGYRRLTALNNPDVLGFVTKYVKHCDPDTVFVRTDAAGDAKYIREKAIQIGEEKKLRIEGHTVHFDGYYDQARDKANTKFLIAPDRTKNLGSNINSIDREQGLKEIHQYLKNIMQGKEAYVCFFSLGPVESKSSIPAVQITDSAYVAHSEDILYRSAYLSFNKLLRSAGEYFKFVHSAGILDNGVSKNIDQRRVYIDFNDNTIYSANTQYGGNTIGLKKLAMRLAINKAAKDKESWLTEHMFIMGVCGPNNRVTYFTGAYPSGCGKTSTAMLEGERLIGDDIAYLREVKGKVRAINPECGIFGIIRDVSASNDPLIWYALTSSNREVIFSNVLVNEGIPYWMGMGGDISIPERGLNHSSSVFGEWWKGKRNQDNDEIPLSHPNGRYTIKIDGLKNKDGRIDDPEGVEIKGIIYGGRDSDTWLPVEEAFNWEHGILTKGAILESETTATTLGKVGVRKFNPMSNLDFLSISIGTYIKMNLEFGKKLDTPPSIFSVNYFLKDRDGKGMPLSGIHDKRVWLKWMELRVHGDVAAIKTPTGYIPQYNDLKRLFKEVLQKDYSEEDYTKQFTLRIGQNMAKIERTCKIYREDVPDALGVLFDALEEQKQRLKAVRAKYGDYVAPDVFT